MDETHLRRLYEAHRDAPPSISPADARAWVEELLQLLFPERRHERPDSYQAFSRRWGRNRDDLLALLTSLGDALPASADTLAGDLLDRLPALRDMLLQDADAIYAGDPAATDHAEVIRTYPGFMAIAVYRVANHFCRLGVPAIPRVLTEYAHAHTGIDIHPAATIGERFCIDHGTGIVIGETTEIGRNVKLYQGTTLGALSVQKTMARIKRHPTVEDDVVIYAGATVLGGDTVVGRGSIIGGNVWLLTSVPPYSRVYYDPDLVIEEPREPGEDASPDENG